MGNKKLVNRLIKLTEHLCSVIKNSIPAYSCRKSKHVYKQYQLAAMWCLMKYLKTDYRGIIEQLELMPQLKQIIGLNQLPHFTTIHKFFQRFTHINQVLSQSIDLFYTDNCILALDATGYSSTHASSYYTRMVYNNREIRRHIKSSIAIDTDNQAVVSQKTRLGPRNDCLDSEELIIRAGKLVNPIFVVADKGYDSEENHRIANKLGARCMIPTKKSKYGTVRGRYRRRMHRYFDEQIYHKRSLVETVFSVIKRIFGSWVQSRLLINQIKEIRLMCVIYNVYRYVTKHISVILVDVFYRAFCSR